MITVPEVHIVIAHNTSQIVVEIKEALANIRLKYQKQLPSFITFVTGPSRTSDIETLVMGAQGLLNYLFLIEEEIKPIFENRAIESKIIVAWKKMNLLWFTRLAVIIRLFWSKDSRRKWNRSQCDQQTGF